MAMVEAKSPDGSTTHLTPEKPPSPPGPTGLPIVGSLLKWKGPHTNLQWTSEFGGIYRVQMGSKNLVYLNKVELVEKYLEGKHGEKYLDRPMGPGAIAQGLLFGSGDHWKQNKRAFMKALHNVNFVEHMENSLQFEIKLTMEDLHKNVDKPIKMGDFFLSTCTHAIAGLLLGDSLPPSCQDRMELMTIARSLEGVDLNSLSSNISMKYPKLRGPLSKLSFRNIVDVHGTSRRLQNLLRQWIRQANTIHLSPISPGFEKSSHLQKGLASTGGSECLFHKNKKPKVNVDTATGDKGTIETPEILTSPKNDDLIECALKNATQLVAFGFTDIGRGEQPFEEVEPPSQPSSPFTPLTENQWTFKQMSLDLKMESILQRILKQPEFAHNLEGNDAELLQSLIDMFFGGVTSTLASMEFILVHLTRNQDFQRIARQEVDKNLAEHKGEVTFGMREKMPYVHACITEALRLGSVTPSSLPHVATKETEIEGYIIPKGEFVMASIYSIHRDPTHYLDPEEFRPHRHLDAQKKFKPPTSYKPFGIGARRCVGDKMAEMQLFVYTVNVLRHFELHPISSTNAPSLNTHMRIINRLKDFRCVLRKRDIEKTI